MMLVVEKPATEKKKKKQVARERGGAQPKSSVKLPISQTYET